MSLIIDKRNLPKNATVGSRQKFIERYKSTIKKRIKGIVSSGSMKDIIKGGKKIKIKMDDLAEPEFRLEPGTGKSDRIYIGNKVFHKGQKVDKPNGGQGGRGTQGGKGDGEDEFEFELTEKEFMDMFFEDLALPDMVKKQFIGSCFEIQHAGLSRSGGPTSLNIKRTMINALGRRLALRNTNPYLKNLTDEEYAALIKRQVKQSSAMSQADNTKKKVQYIEDIDLRYNFKEKVDVPTTKAVMFCLMDVSGSMGEGEKDIAKRFFILLNMFLKRNYNIVDIVFVRHTELADEVDEETFFYDKKSGGTIISSGYEKVAEIIKQRYSPEQWNIYAAQASDGENWEEDMEHMEDVLIKDLLPVVQYFAYIDIAMGYRRSNRGVLSEVMTVIKRLMDGNSNLQGREVSSIDQIWEVFRSLFKKKETL